MVVMVVSSVCGVRRVRVLNNQSESPIQVNFGAVQCSAAQCGARTWDTTWHGTTAAGRIWGRARQNQVVVYNGYYSTVSATGQRRNLQEGERLLIFFAGPPLAPVGGNSGLGQWRIRRARGPLGSALRDDAGAASAPEVWLWLFGFGRQAGTGTGRALVN